MFAASARFASMTVAIALVALIAHPILATAARIVA